MGSIRLSSTTFLPLVAAVLATACVPKAPSMSSSTGDGGTGPTERPPVGGVATCQFGDEEITSSAPATPAKMACTDVKASCFPFVRPYTTAQADWDYAKAAELMRGMNNTQKANQLRGSTIGQFFDIERTWHDQNDSAYNDTKGIMEFKFRDASRGLNFAVEFKDGATNYATAFPVSMARGAAFDLDLEYRIGQAAGDEMVASGNTMLLAPCVNILRHPLWGRAQETYGEDSFLLGRLGAAYTIGLQEYVASCVKHYAANNVENGRQTANAIMEDEQTLREIYARHFEMIIRDGGISSVMASYNKVNGTYSTENTHTLTDILRGGVATGGFDFRGFVLSDWWAMQNHITNTPDAALAARAMKAGLDMELGWNLNYSQLESNVQTGTVTQEELDLATQRVLAQKVRFNGTTPNAPVGLKPAHSLYSGFNAGHSITNNETVDPVQGQSHIALAQEAAVKSMVLLKNDNNTLPIKRTGVSKIAVLGRKVNYTHLAVNDQNDGMIDFARTPRIGDSGSSRVFIDFSKSSGPLQGIQEAAGSNVTVNAFDSVSAMGSFNPDFIVVVAGLTGYDEGEEYTNAGDRPNFDLDAKASASDPTTGGQVQLINDAIALKKPMVLVLEGGSVITIPSLSQLPAVVMAWYPGMDGGRALGKLLFGDANFSGKLPITWPKQLADIPYPLKENDVGDAHMGYFLGYRLYDDRTQRMGASAPTPLFPFGFGLSYTKFTYANLQIPCTTIDENSIMDITVDVTNAGAVDGEEVVFLFASFPTTEGRRSVKELKSFRKVMIKAHTTKRVHIPLRIQDLKYFKMDSPTASTGKFVVEKGDHGTVKIMVGGSSDNLPVSDTFQVN
jgi:beta-glucosidase